MYLYMLIQQPQAPFTESVQGHKQTQVTENRRLMWDKYIHTYIQDIVLHSRCRASVSRQLPIERINYIEGLC
jgi:hypothetical protein